MSAEEIELLRKVVRILARMPREFAQSGTSLTLWRAMNLAPHDLAAELLRAGPKTLAADLAAAAFTLRGTGHFAEAECLDQLAGIMVSWDRRQQSRPDRRSGERH